MTNLPDVMHTRWHERLIPVVAATIAVLLVAGASSVVVLPRLVAVSPAAAPLIPPASPVADTVPTPRPDVVGPPAVPSAAEEVADPALEVVVDTAPEEAAGSVAPGPDSLPPVTDDPAERSARSPPAASPTPAPSEAEPARRPDPAASSPEPELATAPATDSERIFASRFPAQAAATQDRHDPATTRWAVLVGVNRYQGRTSSTLGSVADALALREVLLAHGWRDDHIVVLLDGHATHDWIVRGIEWLIRKTDASSTAVFSFSGHMQHRWDGQRITTALWPADNRYLWAADFGRLMAAVPAGQMWVSLQGCHAAGMAAPGLEGPNRIVTYSSRAEQKSYEDPEVGHSVQGYYLFVESFRHGWGDLDGDGRVSVHEAYNWATPRAHARTSGRQNMTVSDGFNGQPLFLTVGG